MFLSRMYLNPQRRETRKLVASPQAMHAAVLASFPPDVQSGDGKGRVLWRLDQEGHTLSLYIVSPGKPSFEHLQQQAGWENEESWAIRDYAPVLDSISRGKRFRFRLDANPVRSVHDPDTGKVKRFAHVTATQQREWLIERADSMGVKFLPADTSSRLDSTDENSDKAVTVSRREIMKFRRNNALVTIARAQFDGVLEVTDAEKFLYVLTNGIGRAKSYGCGLMTLAPIHGYRN